MLLPYPNVFPQEALMMMLDKFRGKEVAVPDLVNAAWNVLGYGLSQSLGGGQIVAGEVEALSKMTDEEVIASVLQQHGADVSSPGVVGVGIVPMLLIAKIALKVLVNLLA